MRDRKRTDDALARLFKVGIAEIARQARANSFANCIDLSEHIQPIPFILLAPDEEWSTLMNEYMNQLMWVMHPKRDAPRFFRALSNFTNFYYLDGLRRAAS